MSDEVTTYEQVLELDYEWPFGDHGTRFFEGFLEEGRVHGSKCPECGSVAIPPVSFCTPCFVETEDELAPVQDTGTLNTYTEIHIPFPGQGKEPPYIWAFVDLDGADTTFTHILGECDVDDVEVGMDIEAVWKPEDEREGKLTDIEYFRPVDPDLRTEG